MEAERSEPSSQILSKNIWELEQRMRAGQDDPLTRLVLMRAYALQVEAVERALGIPAADRAYLRVNERTRDGVLLIHGSTGTPAELRPLADKLYNAGFTVYGMRLPSHGLPDAKLERSSWQAALSEVQTRYRVLTTHCQRPYVIGFSFGGALAMHLDVQPHPRALVLLAPALIPRTSVFMSLLARLGLTHTSWFRRRLGWNAEVSDAMDSARKQSWWHGLPVLAVMADDDARISARSVGFIQAHSTHTGTEIVRYKAGGHVFMSGPHQEELESATLAFLKRN